jgi:REP element-mobilizing transposase RayT
LPLTKASPETFKLFAQIEPALCESTHNDLITALLVDHVHILIQLPPSVSVSKAAQLFKGLLSKLIRSEISEVKKFLWGKDFWADGCFSETVGSLSENRIRKYIQNQ